jgi:transposase
LKEVIKIDIMKKNEENATNMTPEGQWILRQIIVKLYLKGFDAKTIADIIPYGKLRHVQSTIKKYKEGGWEAIALKKMGRPKNSNTKLNPEQEAQIKDTLTEKTPVECGCKGFLWNLRNVVLLVFFLFQIDIPCSTMSKYLNRWGFTSQRPIIRNYSQNPESVRKWLEEEYPAIKMRAEKENVEIFWGDEAGIQNECNYARGYAPKGKTPEAKLNSSHKMRVSIMSAISNQGKLRFMIYEETMTQQRLIKFMKRLIKGNDRKVYLILDNLKVHHGGIVQEWLKKHEDKIRVYYLPSYSPERNPDEYFNGNLKRELEKRGNARTKEEFKSNVRASAMKIQADKSQVKRLFEADFVTYAAA